MTVAAVDQLSDDRDDPLLVLPEPELADVVEHHICPAFDDAQVELQVGIAIAVAHCDAAQVGTFVLEEVRELARVPPDSLRRVWRWVVRSRAEPSPLRDERAPLSE